MVLRLLIGQRKSTPEFRLAVIAVVVFVAMAAFSPDRFLSSQNIVSMAFQFPEFAILALAMTIAMMTGGIDLSVVGVANLTAVISALILVNFAGVDMTGGPALLWLVVSLSVAVCVGGFAGLFNGILVARFGLPPILATLGSGLVFTGIAVAMTGGSAVMGFPDVVAVIGNAQIMLVPVPLIIFALLAGGALFGFAGVLLAVPVAAVIGVLARFTITQYMTSPLYDDGEVGMDKTDA